MQSSHAIFMGIMLSSAYLFIIGKLSIKYISKISDVPNRILYPVVLILRTYGAYAVNNNLFDVLVMLIMGIIGFTLLRLDIPTAPFLIAFVLGPLLEDNFRQSLLLSSGDVSIFVRSPICMVFWALTLLTLFMLVRSYFKKSTLKN